MTAAAPHSGEPTALDTGVTPFRFVDFVAIFFVSVITAVTGLAIGATIGGSNSLEQTSGGLIGLWAGIVPGTVIVCRTRATGNLVTDLGLRFAPRDAFAVAVGFASQATLAIVVGLFASPEYAKELEAPAKELTRNAQGGLSRVVLAVLLVVGAPVVEEIFYRGMLLRTLRRRMPPFIAVVISALIFGAAHFDLATFPLLAAFGVVLGWLAHRTDRLGPSIFAHAAFNASAAYFLLRM